MSEKYKVQDQDSPYFVTFAVESWVDVFTRQLYRDIVLDFFAVLPERKRFNYLRLVPDDQSHSPYNWT